jgi:hypothetical protein
MDFPVTIRTEINNVAYHVTLQADGRYSMVEITTEQESLALRFMKVYNLWQKMGKYKTVSKNQAINGQYVNYVYLYQPSHGQYYCSTYANALTEPEPKFSHEEIDWLLHQELLMPMEPFGYNLHADNIRAWLTQQVKDAANAK